MPVKTAKMLKNKFLKTALYAALFFVLSVSVRSQSDISKGIELYKAKNFDQAIGFFNNFVKINPANADGWYYLGVCQIADKKPKDAERSFRKAIAIDPTDASYHIGLGIFYLTKNKSDDAKAEANKALDIDSKQAEAHFILGTVFFRQEVFSNAYSSAKKAIELNPKLSKPYLLKAQCLIASFTRQMGTVLKDTSHADQLMEAAADLEKYISLSAKSDDENRFLRDYLESIRFFADYYSKTEANLPDNPSDKIVPLNVTRKDKAQYTDEARYAQVEGTVRLIAGFSTNGKIQHVMVVKSLGFGLDETAVSAVKAIKFEPQKKNGQPVAVVKTIDYVFTLR